MITKNKEEKQNCVFVYELVNEASLTELKALKKYIDYKTGVKTDYNSEDMLDINILSLLEENGFLMNKLGTYLYKDVIRSIIKELGRENTSKEVLTNQLDNPYSQFYFNISRNEKDMGLKTFHAYIQESIFNINYELANSNLIGNLCANGDLNYGQLALILAEEIVNKDIDKIEDENKSLVKPNIKRLTNMPKLQFKRVFN